MKKLENISKLSISQAQTRLNSYFSEGKDVAIDVQNGQVWIVEYTK